MWQCKKHYQPDITAVHKGTQEWTLVDIPVPADQNILTTEEAKVERHQDFTLEMKRVHRAPKLTVIPIMIGALGTILKNAKAWLRRLSLPDIFGSVQLSAILGTAHILRKVLCL